MSSCLFTVEQPLTHGGVANLSASPKQISISLRAAVISIAPTTRAARPRSLEAGSVHDDSRKMPRSLQPVS